MVSVAGRRLLGLAVSGVIVGAVIAACRPNGDVGYVEIKTSGRADHTDGALYRLRQTCAHPEGKRDPAAADRHLKLQADGTSGALAPLCEIVVARNRITTVTNSALERPPRCNVETAAPTLPAPA